MLIMLLRMGGIFMTVLNDSDLASPLLVSILLAALLQIIQQIEDLSNILASLRCKQGKCQLTVFSGLD